MVGHVSPEAARGGPIGLLRTGDRIVIDVERRVIETDADLDVARPGADADAPARGDRRLCQICAAGRLGLARRGDQRGLISGGQCRARRFARPPASSSAVGQRFERRGDRRACASAGRGSPPARGGGAIVSPISGSTTSANLYGCAVAAAIQGRSARPLGVEPRIGLGRGRRMRAPDIAAARMFGRRSAPGSRRRRPARRDIARCGSGERDQPLEIARRADVHRIGDASRPTGAARRRRSRASRSACGWRW